MASKNSGPLRLMIFRPHMADGGADRVTITLLRQLDRSKFSPILVLSRREGVLLDEVPADIPIVDLGSVRLRASWLSLAKLLHKVRPDIFLSMSSPAGNPVASFAHLLSRTKGRLVLSRRNAIRPLEEGLILGRLFGPVHRLLYRRADAVIAVSKGVASDLETILGVPRELLQVIYNPLPDEILKGSRAEKPPHSWFNEQIPVLLAVGRLVREKDYPTLLRSVALVRKHRAVRLIVLGKGALEKELRELANRLGISGDVHFEGWTPNPAAYMQWCSVFVLASKSEGLCTALLEALGSGAAVVSTNCHAGPAEMIVSGKNGLLVPVGDSEAMARSVESLLDNAELRLRLGENARDRAKVYSASNIVASYEKALLG